MKNSCVSIVAVIPVMLLTSCVDNRNDFAGAAPSAEVSAASDLPAPENLSASATDNEVSLSWDEVEGASAYNVYVYSVSDYIPADYSFTSLNTVSTDESTRVSFNGHLLSGLEYEVDYYFKVTALADTLESDRSNEVGIRPFQNFNNSTPYLQLFDSGANAAEVVTLSAEVSDPDGNEISYLWQQVSGESVNIEDSDQPEAYFTAPTTDVPMELGFVLTVNDGYSATNSNVVTVSISDNLAPQVDAGADQSVSAGTMVNLLGSVSDSGGSIVDITWQQQSGNIVSLSSTSSLATSFTAPSGNSSELTLVFQLSATDDSGASTTDTVTVLVAADQGSTIIYRVDVAENSNGTIHVATTIDSEQESLTYSLSGTDADDFNIDSSSGAISFVSTPDYENPTDENEDNVYELTFEVSDGTTATLQELVITVIDVDEAPTITSAASASVSENNNNNIYSATATDPENNSLTYSLSGTDAANFTIDSSSGAIAFAINPDYENPADSEANNVYALTLEVSDSTHTISQALTIAVTNIDEAPTITSDASASALENTSSTIYTASASDPENGALRYSLSGTDANNFTIDSNSGAISFTINPDYENPADSNEINTYEVELQVTDAGGLSDYLDLQISVTDFDEYDVSFSELSPDSNTSANAIAEDAAAGTAVGITSSASDDDGTDDVSYSFDNDSQTSADTLFSIASDTGVITLASGANLDHETDSSHEVVVKATSDDTSTATATFTISVTDVNDNTPVITALQSFVIDENSEDMTSVGTVAATDADSDAVNSFTWSIADGNDNNAFAINSSTGEITVADASQLDYETEPNSYNLSITVSDGSTTSSAETVTINVTDLNDNTPVITASQSFSVDENSANASSVGTVVVTDADVTATTYQDWKITGSNTDNAFDINSSSGEITVADASQLDYETEPNSYNLSITVSDGSTTSSAETVTINVTDLNDNTPVITASQSFSVDENSANASSVGTVVVTDADATATTYQDWKITGGNTDNAFDINSSSGEITVADASQLDYETEPNNYNLSITVSDGSTTSSAETVTINVTDLNDNTPVITASQSFGIDENSANATSIGIVAATDADVTTTTYQDWKITGGNTDNAFDINSSSGEITVADASQLDYETEPNSYNLSITVSDGSTTSSAETVTINVTDLNDNTPVITASQSFSVDENSANASSVGTVVVTDADATATTYQDWKITGGNTDNAFDINSSSGEITVADASQLDYETEPNSYNLSITVSDGTNISSAETVTINVTDLNDNTPVITASQSFDINENSEDDTLVGTVEVSDGDVTATTYQDWKITGGNTDNAFDINSSSGEITVADASQLDYETEPNSYNLSITVSDGTNISSAETVTINVTDLNDNTPVITASQSFDINENSEDDTLVGTVEVSDGDVTATTYQDWKITGGNTDNAFDINSSSGEITVADASQLDYETEPNSYNLSITVSDGSTTSSAETVTINVTDLNDNTPVITASQSFGIDENSANATSIGIVAATDADVTTTTYQDWKITGGNTDNAFDINSSSGEITVADASQLDYETEPNSYNLSITVSDGSTTSSAETVTINVTDLNDNTPVITASQSFSVDENSANASSVGTVVVTDADVTATTYQDWKITGGNTDNAFDINSSSGEITVADASQLDYETEPNSYNLSITVSDGSTTSSAETVTINVTDLNDDTPVITASQSFDINENSDNGTSVGTVGFTDADSDAVNSFTWSITGGNTNDAFAIDESTGAITVANGSELDYESGTILYTLNLTVSDGASISEAENITINILDVSEHDAAPNAAYLGLPDNYINITFTPESGVSYQLHRSFVEGCTSSSCDAEGYKLFASPNSSGTADTMTFSQTHYYSLVGDNATTFTTSINDSDGAKLAALVAGQSLSTEYDLTNDWVNISATDSNNVTYTLYMAGEPFAAGGCEDSELDNIGSLCADGSSLSDGSMHSATEVINWSARRYYRLDISDGYQVVHSLESNASVIDPVVLNASNASLTIDITWSAFNSSKLAEYTVYLSDDSAATTASAATWSSLSNPQIISGNSSELYSLIPILSQYYVAITATNTESETTPLSKVYLANNIVTGDPDPSTWHEIIADTDDSPAHWEGRSTHGSLVFQDKMWLIGGRTASENHIAEVWSSTDGYNWTEVTPSAAFGARKEFVSMVHDGKMWVLGGEIEGNLLANDVWYSSDGATWHEATPAASWHVRDYFGGVAFASGATGSDEMWVLGHYTGDARGIPGVEDHHYSTDGSTWSSVSVSGLPPSSFFPAITFNNVILIVGGYFYTNSAWSESNTIYSSTDGVNWAELSVSGSIWDARRLHTTLVYDDKLWILAGYSGYNRDDYWYSPDGTQWHEVMASGSKWEARQVHTSVNYAGRMWMLGGYGSTGDKQLNDVWASGLEITSFLFNPATTN